MANQLQLQRQIQEEIDREAKIDRLIKNQMKKFFKQNKQFKIVDERKDCDSILYFYRKQPISTSFAIDDKSKDIRFDKRYTYFFLKNKNHHDGRRSSRAFKKDKVNEENIRKKIFFYFFNFFIFKLSPNKFF